MTRLIKKERTERALFGVLRKTFRRNILFVKGNKEYHATKGWRKVREEPKWKSMMSQE